MGKGIKNLCFKNKNKDVDDVSEEGDENVERGNWSRQLDFVLSCIGYAVGLGNIWRFPYLCMRNGGGAFIIPYFTFLFLCGIPLFFMELSLGQFSNLSPVSIWRICPIFKGVGWGMVIVSGVVCVYYNIIITWVLYYLFASFTSSLPWGSCNNTWNRPGCVQRGLDEIFNESSLSNTTYFNNDTSLTNITNVTAIKKRTSAEEYFHYSVLEMTDDIGDLGGIKWQLLLCLILSWVIVFLCLCKGVKSSGKVVYVTATFPYVFLTILLIRGLMLPGSVDGIKYYIIPDFKKLLHIKVWQEAALQIFYSLGPAWGGLITMSSYNKFNNNCYRDSILVPCVNCGTSFYGGFVIFSVIGYMARLAKVEVDQIVTSGPGLAFIVYPEALTRLPISPLWSILFFLMLLTIGLDSQFGMFETLVSAFADEFPKYLKKRKTLFAGILCLVEFLLGLVMVTRAGMYIFQILDWYAAAFSVMLIALVECVTVAWIYGADRLYDEIEMMIGYRPCMWWKICWKFITPCLMIAMLIYSLVQMTPPKYGDYDYPEWARVIGWMVALISIVPVPARMLWELLVEQKGSFRQRLRNSFKPEDNWGPGVEKYREEYFAKQRRMNGMVYVGKQENVILMDQNHSHFHEKA